MQRWLYAAVVTILAYLAVLKLPLFIGAMPFLFGGHASGHSFVYHLGPLVALGLALWVLLGPAKPIRLGGRLAGVTILFVVGFGLLSHSIRYLHIPQSYDYQPSALIASSVVIALGLFLAAGDLDGERLQRWIIWALIAGTIGCLAIDFVHWLLPPVTFKYSIYQSLPALTLAGGMALRRLKDEALLPALVRWALAYVVASVGAFVLSNYREASSGFWDWLFQDLYRDAAITAGWLVVGLAVIILVVPSPASRRRGLASSPAS